MPTLYAPGRTPVVVTPRGFAALAAGASAPLLVRIRALLAEGRGLGGVIEAVTGAYGSSLTAIPAFAVALVEGESVRVAVRGGFSFDIDAASSEHVSGAGVTTWSERVVAGVQRVTLTTSDLDASSPDAASPAEYEIADGIVLAASMVWDAAAPRSSSAPVAQPAPSVVPTVPAAAPEPPAAESASENAERIGPSPADDGRSEASAADGRSEASAADAPSSDPWPVRVVEPSPAAVSDLIDSHSVPSILEAETLLPLDSALLPVSLPDDEEPPEGAAFDAEWGATVIRSVGEPGAGPSGPSAQLGDHDGATISLAQARALRASAGAEGQDAASALPLESVPSPLAPPRPPAPGRLRMSTGQVVPLDRTVVIGRRPRSTRVSGTDLPHLVAVDSPQQDISRSHVELRVEGESILATDLRTTNGTTLLRTGADPVRLHPGEGTVVVPGDVLDLGDGITVAIEGLS